MRVELFGNKPLVSSVEVSLSAAGLHVLVNLAKRGAPAHCQGSSLQFRARPEEEFLPHDTLVFCDPDATDDEAEEAGKVEVVIAAESDDEARLLLPVVRYQVQEKDQFTVLYVPYKAFLPGTTLVSYRSAG